MKIRAVIERDELETVGEIARAFGDKIKEERISRIVPENPLLRFLFLFLRKTFGDKGKVANWTRRWKCRWIVQFKDGKVLGPFNERASALQAEIEELSRRLESERDGNPEENTSGKEGKLQKENRRKGRKGKKKKRIPGKVDRMRNKRRRTKNIRLKENKSGHQGKPEKKQNTVS